MVHHPHMLQRLVLSACSRPASHHAAVINAPRAYITSAKSSPTVAQLLKAATADSAASRDGSSPVTLNGFVRTVRKQKRVAFAAIGDGTSLDAIQAVLTPEQAKELSTGSAVSITGQWQTSPSGKEQTHELLAHEVRILGSNDAEHYPIQKKFHSVDFLRTLPHLRTRIPFNSLLLRLRSEAIRHVTNFFAQNDYIQTHPPIVTSSDCEGAGEVFTVKADVESTVDANSGTGEFFKAKKYLTVSSQLHLEALAQSVGKVWTLSPTFRAEHSDTPRHLSEFYMLEAETCFVNDVNEVMDVTEGLLRAIVKGLQTSSISEELFSASARRHLEEQTDTKAVDLEARWKGLIAGPWPRISYTEAVRILKTAVANRLVRFDQEPQMGASLQAEHEKYLADNVGNGSPVFVTDYPRDVKAFYMSPSTTEQALPTVACFDLLVPDLCEIVGGSMREHRLDPLLKAMQAHGLLRQPTSDLNDATLGTQDLASAVPAALQWYVDLRRFGTVPHGGFGLGFDRFLCYLSGVSSIRDVVTFPRWYGRCDC